MLTLKLLLSVSNGFGQLLGLFPLTSIFRLILSSQFLLVRIARSFHRTLIISDVIIASYVVDPTYFRLHYYEVGIIVIKNQSTIGTIKGDRVADITLGFGFKSFVDASISKDIICRTPFHSSYVDAVISWRSSLLVETIEMLRTVIVEY